MRKLLIVVLAAPVGAAVPGHLVNAFQLGAGFVVGF
jgi:hypothetical protein